MSITTTTPENADAYGRFTVVTRQLATGADIDPATGAAFPPGSVISVHRAPLQPGTWGDAGAWLPTDVSAQDATIQAFAAALWITAVVDAFKAAFPFDPSPAAP